MKVFPATTISPGLARGTVWIAKDPLAMSDEDVSDARRDTMLETAHLDRALAQVKSELRAAADEVSAQMSEELAGIFKTHELMLESLLSSREFNSEIESSGISSEAAVRRVFKRREAKFLRIQNPIFRGKADDLADLLRRILQALRSGKTGTASDAIPSGSIVVAQRLLPSDVIPMSREAVAGIVVEELGKGSHAALLVREKGIPTLAGVFPHFDELREGDEVLVDASREEIILEPDQPDSDAFNKRLEAYRESIKFCRTLCHEPAETLGGAVVRIMANIGSHETAEAAAQNGADGVGLFRLEQLYLGRDRPPDSDELFTELLGILKPLRGKSVTIRLLDIGGDKLPRFMDRREDRNSLLGRRGVRLLLAHPELVRCQLKALLQLSVGMEIKILVPLVTLPADMQAIRTLFDELVASEKIAAVPPLGAMIETPAAALRLEDLCPFSDFFSIGSNDLTQYTLAAARENPEVNDYYQDTHPAVLGLVRMIVEIAGSKPVTLCGELAGREAAIPQLVALGLRSLSVAPIQIPFVKQQIRTLS
jgi:phosphoenolpyruvate-protein phosphotransferase (PTS system enzyme I)